jgi:hypothetical protein
MGAATADHGVHSLHGLILGDIVDHHTEDCDAPQARALGAHGYVRFCRHDASPSYSE